MEGKYLKSFEVRWSDIDANVHLIHTAYSGFMAHTRMCFLDHYGITMAEIGKSKLGPVLLNEQISFLKEVRPMETVYVDIELSGMTEDYKIFRFDQGLYKSNGEIAAYSRLLIAFIHMEHRKLAQIPEIWKKSIEEVPRTKDFKFLSKDDLKHGYVPYGKKIEIVDVR